MLAQIGEFSFVLGAVAIDRGLIDTDLHRFIVSVTALSLFCSPFWMASARRLNHRAAYRVEGLGALLRLIYFREWRASRRVSRMAIDHATNWLATLREFTGRALRRKQSKPAQGGTTTAPTSTTTQASHPGAVRDADRGAGKGTT
jgi:CPA2 family monovalent cation:H+ antiporter-2